MIDAHALAHQIRTGRLSCRVLFVLLGGLALLLGYLIDPLAGVALLALIALSLLVWELMSTDPQRGLVLHEAEKVGHRTGGEHRILLIVSEIPGGDALRDAIFGSSGDEPPALEVFAPVLQSRTHFVTTDIDHETERARRRLSETLDWVESQGLAATGAVGDPIDLWQASLMSYGASTSTGSCSQPLRSSTPAGSNSGCSPAFARSWTSR